MSSKPFSKRFRTLGRATALAIALATPVATASAQTPETEQPTQVAFAELPEQERTALEEGQVMLSASRSGEKGQFVARVLIEATPDEAWAVLTDYDNFEQFLPNVENSQLLESEDSRRVFEQLNVISVVPSVVEIRSRVVIESTESPVEEVAFQLVEGDLELLEGVWQLSPVATVEGEAPDKVLITHQVDIDPGDSSPRGLFFSTYRLVLEDSLMAAKAEAERRASEE